MTGHTTRFKQVASVVPLALVSVAWTAHVAGSGPALSGAATPTPLTAAAPGARPLPDAPVVPLAPLDRPASLSASDEIAASVGRVTPVVSTPSSTDIPSAALAAYQRAETVISAADPTCRLSWQLLAAVGRVESDHGRVGGGVTGADGVSTPPITGPVLDGRHGTRAIPDTDAGQYDGDTRYDRAVGPMQFIPSTWAVVGVDADDDGNRNPQDLDDAALAAAVYLCSGDEDLSSPAGQRLAVHRYNRSDAYVTEVLAVMAGYLRDDHLPGPRPVLSARTALVGPPAPAAPPVGGLVAAQPAHGHRGPTAAAQPVGPSVVSAGTPATAAEPVGAALPGGPGAPVDPPTQAPADPDAPADPTPDPPPDPEPDPGTLTPEDAALYCAELDLVDDPTVADDDYDTCLATYTAPADETPVPTPPSTPSSPPATPRTSPSSDEARPVG
ncbi:lytic murein transglycosylase [Nocardioides rubriscoriae]|uniref:lytic murein transglycosylase n=1 Tax=Nocardioides rubriscoriae TaxID=642762 RepID=UPI0011DFDDC6|nr:lytic murein transglycosylase [Nocardioides rubriscoriae]